MGNSEIKTSSISAVVGIKDFRQDKVIGKGGFGKVWKTFHKSSARFFAMKEMSKNILHPKAQKCEWSKKIQFNQ